MDKALDLNPKDGDTKTGKHTKKYRFKNQRGYHFKVFFAKIRTMIPKDEGLAS
jgi:hypothetical protein